MRGSRPTMMLAITGLLVGCSDGGAGRAPTAADRITPPETPRTVVTPSLDPFTYRAAIDPYKILQLPDLMIQERTRTDIVMQRIVFPPGPGIWHTNSGPSFIYVIQGQIKFDEFSDKEGCTETPVRGAGEIFFAEGNEVHRAVVVSSENVVLLVTRFNIPVGGAITIPVPDPGC